jgi:hypothetical protein
LLIILTKNIIDQICHKYLRFFWAKAVLIVRGSHPQLRSSDIGNVSDSNNKIEQDLSDEKLGKKSA